MCVCVCVCVRACVRESEPLRACKRLHADSSSGFVVSSQLYTVHTVHNLHEIQNNNTIR